MSSNFYRAQDSPQYLLGHGLSLALVLIALIAVVILRFGYQYSNKKRDENNEASSMTLSAKELGELGDRAPQFRYML